MRIFVTVKSLAKRKNYLEKVEIVLEEEPHTLRELLTALVVQNVKRFNASAAETPLVHYLTADEIDLQRGVGKVGFGTKYNEAAAKEQEAVDTAILAFEDGLYRVFIDEEEAERLDDPLHVNDGADIALIKFTMLAGRLW
ncbi:MULTISPECIES: hypothetical protein [Paenibacillus]|uniref:hypothetical protein n=1 Tax=Paenibacillus TaxID=44249 RepID=UPI0022B89D0C|nr:hypothetical protein [Paenibacillus caseinilyticus]MCZ8522067.1 hypothetical protein [Paenibacillus caseinilyticus]